MSGLTNRAGVGRHLEGASLCISASLTQLVHSPEKEHTAEKRWYFLLHCDGEDEHVLAMLICDFYKMFNSV